MEWMLTIKAAVLVLALFFSLRTASLTLALVTGTPTSYRVSAGPVDWLSTAGTWSAFAALMGWLG